MHIVADLQLHSKFSRAVSKDMILPQICAWTRRKGMGLVATGDWTHPLWMKEIKEQLVEMGNGLLKLKTATPTDPVFMLATEVSCIYSHNGKGRRVHTLIWVPTIEAADKINKEMTRQGCNLMSDGRPIIGLSSIQVAELVFTIEPKAMIIPAHAWTPWFSTFGSMSGFDSLEEAFGPYAQQIYAIETGLSSNPAMNWRIKELDTRSIVSFSDAHSGPKLGREATVFDLTELSYDAIGEALMQPSGKQKGKNTIAYTIEFFPEEGKYHWSGHRACNIRWDPKQTQEKGTTCPVCGKALTQGVEQRVGELAGRSEEDLKLIPIEYPLEGGNTIRMMKSEAFPSRPPYVSLVPLQEIISECIGSPVTSPKVQTPYRQLTDSLGGEFAVLLSATHEQIAKVAGERIAVGIEKVRRGDIIIDPGYDGVFGIVKLWKDGEEKPLVDASKEQLTLLS
jgi:PHP family Zn ribbon phosphoesterase